MNSFGVGPNLYPLRLILPFILVYFFTVFFQKVFLLKQKVIIQPIVLYSFLFFVLMFFNTYAVSFIRFHLLDTYYEFNSILNFSFLLFFILTIYLVIISSPKEFNQISKKIILLFYVAYTLFSAYEIHTGNHLPVSDLFDAPRWMRHMPTVVYFNSNDFAFIFTLMMMYVLSVFDQKKTFSSILIVTIFIIHIFIMYKCQSRLSLLLSFFFFLYRYPKKIIYSSILGLLLFFVLGYFLENALYMQVIDDIVKLKSDLSFNERQSTSVRLSLYKHAILSVLPSFGLGFGIDYSTQYYQSIKDANLHYIVNPHSFIFELLINSGILSTLFYIAIFIWLLIKNWIHSNYDFLVQIIFFNLLIFSSSSSLFIWPVYFFFNYLHLQSISVR